MKDLYDVARAVEPVHQLFLNHFMGCKDCHAATNRYCSTGKKLKAEYIEAFTAQSKGLS